MATSGSTDYNQTRSEIINDAFQLIGVYGSGRTVSAEDEKFAVSMLNKMVKAWQAQGIHLFGKQEAYLFGTKGTAEYQLGNAATDARVSPRDDVVITELSADEAASQTTISLDSSSGMAVADIIGIELDDGTTHWSTVASVPDGTSVTIDNATSGAASENNNVYVFTSRINKPLRIHSMRRKSGVGTSASMIPMKELSYEEYFDLPTRNTTGVPSHFMYNPQRTNGKLYLYPAPSSDEYHYEITMERTLEDMDAASNNIDFPVEWLECITYQLAYRLAPAFGKDKNMLMPEASIMLEQLLDHDAESVSIQFVPDYS